MIKKQLSFFLFVCLMVCSFCSCSEDDDDNQGDIVGAWQLTSKTVDGANVDITGQQQIILFQSSQVFKRYLTDGVDKGKYRIGGWSMSGEALNISLDQPATYYIQQVDATSLSIKRFDFNSGGNLQSTITSYQRVSESLLP